MVCFLIVKNLIVILPLINSANGSMKLQARADHIVTVPKLSCFKMAMWLCAYHEYFAKNVCACINSLDTSINMNYICVETIFGTCQHREEPFESLSGITRVCSTYWVVAGPTGEKESSI